ncbi:MAG: hypothetical protein ACOZF2_14105 [Thermodesulfobacteriota bacterium]
MKRCIAFVAVFTVTVVFFALTAAQAAGLADLAKIQIKVTNEAQVRAILGEPKKSEDILKSGGRREGPKDRKDLLYNLDGKDVIIRINPKTGLVVKIIEL